MTNAVESTPAPSARSAAAGTLGDGVARPSVPEGARCGVHPDAGAIFTCARCGTFGCVDCRFGGEPPAGVVWTRVCRACAEGGLDEPVPWERRRELGWMRAFIDTTRLVCFHPTRFFRTPSLEKGPMGGIFYGVVAYALGQLLLMLALLALALASGGVVAIAHDSTIGALIAGYGCVLGGMTPLVFAQAPAYALLGVVIAGGAVHATLALLKRTRAPFEETMRAMGYAYAPQIWLALPACGASIAYIWMLAVELKAVRETHRVGTDAAVLAVFGFRVVIFLLVIGLYAAMFLVAFLYAPAPQPGLPEP